MTGVVAVVKRAYREGSEAAVGVHNPHAGDAVLAVAWRSGYSKMLSDMLARSPARQVYLREHPNG